MVNKIVIPEQEDNLGIELTDKILTKYSRSKTIEKREYLLQISGYLLEVVGSLIHLDKTMALIGSSLKTGTVSERAREFEYHLGNFYLRWYLFDQRLDQLINSVFTEISEDNFTIHNEIRRNNKTKAMWPILKELDCASEIKKIRNIRKKFTHQKYEVYPHLYSFAYEQLKKEGVSDPQLFMLEKFSITRLGEIEKIIDISKNIFNKICSIIEEFLDKPRSKV
jgi:hypothetical protein